jgi:4-hydroxybenzoate polyprenyltransferase
MSPSETTTERSAGGGGLLALGRLLRLSLAPTALADIAAGTVLGAGLWPSGAAPFLLMLASASVYHGGMALNDWADRAEDARANPARPIPSGALAARAALSLALVLLTLGPLLATAVAPRAGLVLALVAVSAALYDLAGRGPWRGPLLLALCRAGNLGTGLAFASTLAPWRDELLLAPAAYGLYVFLVSRLARLEDTEPARLAACNPSRWTVAACLALCGIGLVAGCLAGPSTNSPGPTPPILMGIAAAGLFGMAWNHRNVDWTPEDVRRTAGMALRRLLIATAAIAMGAGTAPGKWVAVAILCGYPLAFLLRKLFPPT